MVAQMNFWDIIFIIHFIDKQIKQIVRGTEAVTLRRIRDMESMHT